MQRLSPEFLQSSQFNPQVKLSLPPENHQDFPETILQFGTGVLLRGLCDYFVDQANKKGLYRGKIVLVKSTNKGDSGAFETQGHLFTHCIKGIQDGQEVEAYHINAAISRALTASNQWEEVLACAQNPAMEVIISNTTEVGIQYQSGDQVLNGVPQSFPAKLLAFLHARWSHFNGDPNKGMVIIPTELIINNGTVLKGILEQLCQEHALSADFVQWLLTANEFCNSLVDRIVPGKPSGAALEALQHQLGYSDELLIQSEVYALWAIQGNARVKKALGFAAADPGVIIQDDIEIYRELKLRLLNGTHTLLCGMSYLLGFRLVKEVMANAYLGKLVMNLMLSELAPSIPYKMDFKVADRFGRAVLDRFKNPYIDHKLIDITVQYSTKMRMRNIPLLKNYYQIFGKAPELFCMGFAAYLQFMHGVKEENGQIFGESNGEFYPIQCQHAPYFFEAWKDFKLEAILANTELWGEDLNALPGFAQAVQKYI